MFEPVTITIYWWQSIAFLLILLITSFLDPIRDFMQGKLSWMQWHSVKWAAFYPPLLTLWVFVILYFGVEIALYTLAGCFLLWRLGMRVSGQKYESYWKILLIMWWEKAKAFFQKKK